MYLGFVATAAGQEGHPLVGTWHGTWGLTAAQRNDVTFVIEWDGKNVTGIINPGPDSIRLQKAVLEPSNWTVRFEAEVKERSGKMVPVLIDAKIEDVTSRRRSIVGTWTQGTMKGDFKITRDD